MKTRRWHLVVAALAAALAWCACRAAEPPSAPAVPAAETAEVTILHISDTHGRLEPYSAGAKSVGGYARLATMVDEIRGSSKAARVFLVHGGDEFSRGDELAESSGGRANIALMNHLKFDVWTPGNGDFYDGLEALQARIRAVKFPVLAANVKARATGQPVGKPYVIEKAGPVRVAFLGLCWLQPRDVSFESYTVANQMETARQLVPQLRKEADVVVALAHLGLPLDKRLAETVDGIDLVLGGHTHLVLPTGVRVKGPGGREVLVCEVGEYMEWLGRVDLQLSRAGGAWRLDSARETLVAIDEKVKLDPAVKALIARLSEEAAKEAERLAEPAPAK